MLIKVDYKDITLYRLCYYLSESTRGTHTKTMFFSPYIYIYMCISIHMHVYIYIYIYIHRQFDFWIWLVNIWLILLINEQFLNTNQLLCMYNSFLFVVSLSVFIFYEYKFLFSMNINLYKCCLSGDLLSFLYVVHCILHFYVWIQKNVFCSRSGICGNFTTYIIHNWFH